MVDGNASNLSSTVGIIRRKDHDVSRPSSTVGMPREEDEEDVDGDEKDNEEKYQRTKEST